MKVEEQRNLTGDACQPESLRPEGIRQRNGINIDDYPKGHVVRVIQRSPPQVTVPVPRWATWAPLICSPKGVREDPDTPIFHGRAEEKARMWMKRPLFKSKLHWGAWHRRRSRRESQRRWGRIQNGRRRKHDWLTQKGGSCHWGRYRSGRKKPRTATHQKGRSRNAGP